MITTLFFLALFAMILIASVPATVNGFGRRSGVIMGILKRVVAGIVTVVAAHDFFSLLGSISKVDSLWSSHPQGMIVTIAATGVFAIWMLLSADKADDKPA